jgi:hypothetical protein
VDVAGADRLVVINKISFIQPMPLVYRDRLLRIPRVTQATFASWFGGVYQDECNFFPQFAIDREHYREVFTEFIVPDDQWRAFLAGREASIVGEALIQRFKWKVGDRILIRGTIFPGTCESNIRGVSRGQRRQDDVAIPFTYNLRSLRARWTSTVVAILGIAGTVGVFVAMLSLARRFEATLMVSGSAHNALVWRAGATSGRPSPTWPWPSGLPHSFCCQDSGSRCSWASSAGCRRPFAPPVSALPSPCGNSNQPGAGRLSHQRR